jgi:hypothetical protein
MTLIITPAQEKTLRYLAVYKYLTVSQLFKLSVGGKDYIRKITKLLEKQGLVNVSRYGGIHLITDGKPENIYYLTNKGVKVLLENTDLQPHEIKHPKNVNSIFSNDYLHRVSTINIHIAFDLWCTQKNCFESTFETYFHTIGSQKKKGDEDTPLQSVTRLSFDNGVYIQPDGVLIAQNSQQLYFFVLEVCNGVDTKRHVQQIKDNIQAIAKGLPTDKYKQPKNPRLLVTVETENQKKLVIERIKKDPFFTGDWSEKAFLLNVAHNVWQDFGSSWENLKGEKVML